KAGILCCCNLPPLPPSATFDEVHSEREMTGAIAIPPHPLRRFLDKPATDQLCLVRRSVFRCKDLGITVSVALSGLNFNVHALKRSYKALSFDRMPDHPRMTRIQTIKRLQRINAGIPEAVADTA